MICPILSSDASVTFEQCQRERCAWWDHESEVCLLRTIAWDLHRLAEEEEGETHED